MRSSISFGDDHTAVLTGYVLWCSMMHTPPVCQPNLQRNVSKQVDEYEELAT
jgi:hypothetical protein